jgi:hypothetical protein
LFLIDNLLAQASKRSKRVLGRLGCCTAEPV